MAKMLFILLPIGFLVIQFCASISAQSTTASYLDGYMNDYQYPRSKYYYFFTPRSSTREVLQPQESYSSLEDRGQESYEGYQAHWPSKVVHQQPIHVHHQAAPYHKEKSDHGYLLPILLLALLPFFIGALVLLPLLFSFFTNILQLLALIQQNINNMNMNQGTNVPGGGRKKRSQDINPFIAATIASIVNKFIASQNKFNEKVV